MDRYTDGDTLSVASSEETRQAVSRALKRAGASYDELAQQARTGQFKDMRARLAWVAIGDIPEKYR